MLKALSQNDRQPSGFLRLPRELRDKIYSLLLVGDPIHVQHLQFGKDSWTKSIWKKPERLNFPSHMDWYLPKTKTGILGVSKLISEEALDILYGRHIFTVSVHGGAHRKLLNFGITNLRRIRCVRLVAQPMGVCYPDTLKIDPLFWRPLLTDLNRLSLVVQQPLRAGGYYNAPSLEEDMREWVTWLEPILQYLAGYITKTTIVEVDDNNLMETSQLVHKYFPPGYQKARTVTGDRIFMRGHFSLESGYWDDDDSGMNFADGGMGDDWSD